MDDIYFKGVNFGFYARNGYYATPEARLEVERMAESGIQWVCLISTLMQEQYSSTRIFRDFENTPADDELIGIIRLLHEKGIKVMLRPMIDCWDGTQRGEIDPPQDKVIYSDRPVRYRSAWFESYRKVTRHYCRIAEQTKCEAYCFDSELQKLAGLTENWTPVVTLARDIYSGHLTTSLCGPREQRENLEKDPNHWFHLLDSLGISCYPAASATTRTVVDYLTADGFHGVAAPETPTDVESMTAFFDPVFKQVEELAEVYEKPVYFGECGCVSAKYGSSVPWYWNFPEYSGVEQANYLEAIIRRFGKHDWWHGMLWWKWDEQNKSIRPQMFSSGEDRGFTIYGKPAADVMKKWCSGELPGSD